MVMGNATNGDNFDSLSFVAWSFMLFEQLCLKSTALQICCQTSNVDAAGPTKT